MSIRIRQKRKQQKIFSISYFAQVSVLGRLREFKLGHYRVVFWKMRRKSKKMTHEQIEAERATFERVMRQYYGGIKDPEFNHIGKNGDYYYYHVRCALYGWLSSMKAHSGDH